VIGCDGYGWATAEPTNAKVAKATPRDSLLTFHPT
jgi:hypothetical protein